MEDRMSMKERWNKLVGKLDRKGTTSEGLPRFREGDRVMRTRRLLTLGTNQPVDDVKQGVIVGVVPKGRDAMDVYYKKKLSRYNTSIGIPEPGASTINDIRETYLMLSGNTVYWVDPHELQLEK